MLYVFQVDTGSMLTFDMNLALETVSTLTLTIASSHAIPPSAQVLLISGGTPLDPSSRVAHYPAGTDTNPIFLFNKNNIEGAASAASAPSPTADTHPTIEELSCQPATFQSLSACVASSGSILDKVKEILVSSEGLIHDQHLQHLGWGAVVANLEDIVSVFSLRVRKFEADFWKEFDVGEGGLGLEVVEGLPTTISSLASIPMPPSLASCPTLLAWINNNTNSEIESLPGQYAKTVELLDTSTIETLLKDSSSILTKSTNPTMREIGGLSTRLFTLDQLLSTSTSLSSSTASLHSSLSTTTARAVALSDPGLLPDLHSSHLRTLAVCYDNLRKISDINKRCAKAKEELVANLLTRLKWVIFVQKQISELNLKLSVYSEALKKFKNLKTVIRQVGEAGGVFNQCCSEVGRRREVEEEYGRELESARARLGGVWDREVERRRGFGGKYGGHFLTHALFGVLLEPASAIGGGWWEGFHGQYPDVPSSSEYAGESIFESKSNVVMEMRLAHEKEMKELREKHELEIWELKGSFKNELEAVRSRVKFVAKQQEQSKFIESQQHPEPPAPPRNSEDDVPEGVAALASKLSLSPSSIKIGDKVLLYYHAKYEAFLVHGSNSMETVHFLHTDCAREELRREACYLGHVLDKEYCVARRAQNRYKVPAGFHFYRVKVELGEELH